MEFKETNSTTPVKPMVPKQSTGAFIGALSREHVAKQRAKSSAPVKPIVDWSKASAQ